MGVFAVLLLLHLLKRVGVMGGGEHIDRRTGHTDLLRVGIQDDPRSQ